MEKVNFGYSLKNIPIPSNKLYLKFLLEKLNSFIVRLRWKVFYFDHQDNCNDVKEYFGFKSENCPPQCRDLLGFESDLYEMARSVKFKRVNNPFQRQLASDAKMINTSASLFVPADKITNLYKVDSRTYEKLLQDNINPSYEKTDPNTAKKINNEAKAIAKKLKLENRIETLTKKEAFITFKDHKPNFINNPKCRLINPAKSNIGKVSKKLLDAINSEIRRKSGLLQ